MNPSLLVLAAGMGSRYGGLKQIDGVGPNNETLLEYSLFDAKRAGFKDIVFVIRKDIQALFDEHVTKRFHKHFNIRYVYQELDNVPDEVQVPSDRSKPLGTGHAILCAKPMLTENFGVINADDFYGAESFVRLFEFLNNKTRKWPPEFCVVAYPLGNTLSENGSVSRGVCKINRDYFLKEIHEFTQIENKYGDLISGIQADTNKEVSLERHQLVSMNLLGLHADAFQFLEQQFIDFAKSPSQLKSGEFYIPDAINKMLHCGEAKVKVIPTNATWVGVTYANDKEIVSKRIREFIANGVYPENLWA